MRILRWRAPLLLAVLLGPLAAAAAPGPWEQVVDADGIVVHRRKIEGSTLHEFRGRGVVEAPLSRVIAVLRDAERRTAWMERCVGSHAIEQRAESQVLYNRTSAPWPVKDRDVILEGGLELRDGAAWLVFRSVEHPDAPPVEGVVRMRSLNGHWKLVPGEKGRVTLVEYQLHADPAGKLPEWVSNYVSKKLPYKTIESLRRQVKQVSYPEYEKLIEARPTYQHARESGPLPDWRSDAD